jgi:H/ACA ribonucleoprotein complex subunit 3
MDIYVRGKKINLSPQQAIGKGGEADIFDIGKGKAVKVFKQPNHPDYQELPLQQQAASDRLQEHQQKLRQFPPNLPSRAIAPEELATDCQGNTLLGYTMPLLKGMNPLLRYSDRSFRTASGIGNQSVVELFRDLHHTVAQIHEAQVAIGDFNDLNVLVAGTAAYLIDVDSFQYGQFLCRVFTTRFVDPLLCDPQQHQPVLQQAHTAHSDWYAFTVMLMQCLLFVDPYGGIYQPKNKQEKVLHTARPLNRITVFHPEVRYPKPAIPYQVLSDDLLQYFYGCFEQDRRGIFPRQLLDKLQWTKCTNCGLEHARLSCPHCTQISRPVTPPRTLTVRGNVTATPIFSTEGVILTATLQGETLHWLYHEQGSFKRENQSVILTGELDLEMQFWLQGKSTLVGKQGQVIAIEPLSSGNQSQVRLAVDRYQERPMFQCNAFKRYWLYGGQLFRDGQLGSEYIGDVLSTQTQFWVGSHFGFGFYRAGNLNGAFVFDAKEHAINDQIKFPHWSGQLVEANCLFSETYCWFLTATQEQGRILHRLYVITSAGKVIALAEAERGDGSWLSSLQGKCAVGNFLLAATDAGIVRLEPHNRQIIKTKEFPDTETFVDDRCQLLAASQGLYIVSQQQIIRLQLRTP